MSVRAVPGPCGYARQLGEDFGHAVGASPEDSSRWCELSAGGTSTDTVGHLGPMPLA